MAKQTKCIKCKKEIDSKAEACPYCGAKVFQVTMGMRIFVSVIVACIVGYFLFRGAEPELRDNVVFSYSIKKNGLGMAKGDFKVTNNNQVIIKDISVTCVNYSKTNARLNELHTVIYEGVGAGVTRSFKNIDMGMADKNTFKSVCALGNVKKY